MDVPDHEFEENFARTLEQHLNPAAAVPESKDATPQLVIKEDYFSE